jgi:hypothetical protein
MKENMIMEGYSVCGLCRGYIIMISCLCGGRLEFHHHISCEIYEAKEREPHVRVYNWTVIIIFVGMQHLSSCYPHIQHAANHIADKHSEGRGSYCNTYHFTSGTGIPSTSTVNVIF